MEVRGARGLYLANGPLMPVLTCIIYIEQARLRYGYLYPVVSTTQITRKVYDAVLWCPVNKTPTHQSGGLARRTHSAVGISMHPLLLHLQLCAK
jgi:hypothetical protein